MKRKMVPSASDPELLTALGSLTVSFNILEFVLAHAIWSLLGTAQSQGQILTAGLTFRLLVNKLDSLYRARFNDPLLTKRLAATMSKLGPIPDRRNSFVHRVWGEGSSFKITAKAGHGLMSDMDSIPTAKITCLVEDIDVLVADVLQLLLDSRGLEILQDQ